MDYVYFADGEVSLKRVAAAPDSDFREWLGVPVEVFGPRGWVTTPDGAGLFNGEYQRIPKAEALEWIAGRAELTRVQLVEGFAAGAVSLDVVLTKIKDAAEVAVDPDEGPGMTRTSSVVLYGKLCAGEVTEDEYWRIHAALCGPND